MMTAPEACQTGNAYLTAVVAGDFEVGTAILRELSRSDLELVTASLAGGFNGFLRGLAKQWGEDPDEIVRLAIVQLGIAHATSPSP